MSLFAIYFIFFGISTVFGVPILSLFQVTQIKGSSFNDWASGLGATIGPATGIFILVSVISYFILKPVNKLIAEAQERDLSEEEKKFAIIKIKKVNLLSYIFLIIGYIAGNGTTIIIKTLTGKLRYSLSDIIIIIVLIIAYALIAIQYAVSCFNAMSRKKLCLLKINSTSGLKTRRFTTSFAITILSIVFLLSWHLFCTAYSAVRHGWTLDVVIKKGFISLIMGCAFSLPPCFIILNQLKVRFDLTIDQVRTLRKEGNLVKRLDIGTLDDFGQVMTEMNNLMEFLQTSLAALKDENIKVDNDANEVIQVSENSSAGMCQVLSAFQNVTNQNTEKDKLLEITKENISKLNDEAAKVSVAMQEQASAEEINANQIKDMVSNINSMTDLIKKAQVLSESLNESSIAGSEEVDKTQVIIEEINDKSKKMIEVIQVIQKVATQTNLLAMNAAIEAAHAGEAGKGFSVVADEIRKLAENTQKQAKNINDLISEIIVSISNGSDSMKETKEMFSKIKVEINEQNNVVDTISQSMSEQSYSAQGILSNTSSISSKIIEVNNLIKHQANYTEEIKAGIDDVSNLSLSVNQAMNESEVILKEFYQSIETVKEKAMKNHDSVLNITEQLNKFSID